MVDIVHQDNVTKKKTIYLTQTSKRTENKDSKKSPRAGAGLSFDHGMGPLSNDSNPVTPAPGPALGPQVVSLNLPIFKLLLRK